MVKKFKKPNLRTVESVLADGHVYISSNGTTIRETSSGYYELRKGGHTKLFDRLTDAWRSI